jgi:hypothetical protein
MFKILSFRSGDEEKRRHARAKMRLLAASHHKVFTYPARRLRPCRAATPWVTGTQYNTSHISNFTGTLFAPELRTVSTIASTINIAFEGKEGYSRFPSALSHCRHAIAEVEHGIGLAAIHGRAAARRGGV